MHAGLTVSSSIVVERGCPITYDLLQNGRVEFVVGGMYDGFVCVFDTEALRAFMEAGVKALADIDARSN